MEVPSLNQQLLNQPEKPAVDSNARLPFDAEFYKQSEEFCVKALADLPELHGVAIVPLWTNQPENTPPGLLRLRDPSAPYLASVLRLLGRLAAFNVELHRDLMAQLKVFDSYAAQLAEKIKEQTEILNSMTPGAQNDERQDNA
jgi:hypothetical protein